MKTGKHTPKSVTRAAICGATSQPNPDGGTTFVCILAPHKGRGSAKHYFVAADDPRAGGASRTSKPRRRKTRK